MSPPPTIHHDPAEGRFFASVDGRDAECVYRLAGDVMQIVHTEVDPALRGGGIAAALVEAAFAHALQQGLKVMPICSYVRAWVRRHPAVRPLLA